MSGFYVVFYLSWSCVFRFFVFNTEYHHQHFEPCSVRKDEPHLCAMSVNLSFIYIKKTFMDSDILELAVVVSLHPVQSQLPRYDDEILFPVIWGPVASLVGSPKVTLFFPLFLGF